MEELFGLVDSNLKKPLPLEKITVDVKITGSTASISSDLQYSNNGPSPAEVVFVFPAEDRVSVCGFQVKIADRIIRGKLEEKEEARDTYDDALAAGKSAFLLEQSNDSSDVFKISVGNLPSKAIAVVQIRCVITLKRLKDGSIVFTLPTVLNPRYCPESKVGECDNWTAKSAKIPFVELPYEFNFGMQVEVGSEIENILSETHKLKIIPDESVNRKALVKLDGDLEFSHDIEIVIQQKSPFNAHVFTEKGRFLEVKDGGSWQENFENLPVVMLNFLPDFQLYSKSESDTPKEFIFVLDRSGSMSGSNIKSAKEALLLFLKSLPETSYFDIISFGSSFQSFFGRSEKYTDVNLTKASKFVNTVEADMGGTEILKPLEHLYTREKCIKEKIEQNVFLLTDGAVSNTKGVIDLVRKNAEKSRCFALGIGHGASTALVNGVAEAGRGLADFARSDDRLQKKVICMLQKACKARARNITVNWSLSNDVKIVKIPEKTDYVYDEEFLVVYGVITNPKAKQMTGNVSLQYSIGGNERKEDLTFIIEDLTEEVSKHFTLHALAAKNYFTHFDLQHDNVTIASKDELVKLSKASGVMSKYTSYVAVDEGTQVPVEGPMICYDFSNDISNTRQAFRCLSSAVYQQSLTLDALSGFETRSAAVVCSSRAFLRSAKRTSKSGWSLPKFKMPSLPSFNLFGSSQPSQKVEARKEEVARDRGVKCASSSVAREYECLKSAPSSLARRSNKLDMYDPTIEDFSSDEELDKDLHHLDEVECMVANSAVSGYSATKSSNPSHFGLVSLQSASGKWALTKEFSSELGIIYEKLTSNMPSYLSQTSLKADDKYAVWATVLAIVWLTSKQFDSVQDELCMIIEKAEMWLLKNTPTGVTRDQIVQDARKIMASMA